MKQPEKDTISAIITPIGTGGIAVIRVSGPEAIEIVGRSFRGSIGLAEAVSHTVHFGRIVDADDSLLDEVLVTVFRAPRSYTGEDVVEVSCHGSPYIARRIATRLSDSGARQAGPGEFTRRAFLNGRLDLAQAEAVADLIQADSRQSHELALAQLRGSLSTQVGVIRQKVVDLCATLELELDFSEEDLEFIRRDQLLEQLRSIHVELTQVIDSYELGKIRREGMRAVLAGAPNVGKSSILNALIKEQRAIVTEISGTTRDTIEEPVIIDGCKFTIVDTAGLRLTDDPVETEGVRRTREQLGASDLIIYVIDPVNPLKTDEILDLLETYRSNNRRIIIVFNKSDLVTSSSIEKLLADFQAFPIAVTSAKSIDGVVDLEKVLTKLINEREEQTSGTSVLVSNIRQRETLRRALDAVGQVEDGVRKKLTPDLLALDLRRVLTALSEISGVDIAEEVLNGVFSRFCIGK